MKSFRLPALSLLALALAAPLTTQAQTASARHTLAPVSVAYISSGAFLDERTGITQLVKTTHQLEMEFTDTQSDLSLMNEKLRTLVMDLNKLSENPAANAKAIAEKQAEGQKLQQDLQEKQRAAQAAYGKRAQELQGPVAADIAKAMHTFAEQRGIGMLFDATKLGEGIIAAKPELDVTADFIAYYNGLHP